VSGIQPEEIPPVQAEADAYQSIRHDELTVGKSQNISHRTNNVFSAVIYLSNCIVFIVCSSIRAADSDNEIKMRI
jgi:hypothetical protein